MSTVGGTSRQGTGPGTGPTEQISPSVAQIETTLAQAQDLKRWWAEVEAGKAPIERFELFPASPGMEPTYGFFGEAPIQGQIIPVMGDLGDYFFDQPRVPDSDLEQAAQWMVEQAKEFALHYWMRVQAWALPLSYPELDQNQAPRYLKIFSWCFAADPELGGIRNVQRYYKLRESGQVGEFPAVDKTAIVDLRDLKTTYDWITVDRRFFNFNVTLSTDGDRLSLVLPVPSITHLVMNDSLIVNEPGRNGTTLGEFGVGFGLIKTPAEGVIALGSAKSQPALGLQFLRVLSSGEIRLRTVTILARPAKLLNLPPNPLTWGLQAAELATLGAAQRFTKPIEKLLKQVPLPRIGFDPLLASFNMLNKLNSRINLPFTSQDDFEKEMLARNAVGLREGLLCTRPTWLQIPDWVNGPIPDWVRLGRIVLPGENG